MPELIRVEPGTVFAIVFARPERGNALNAAMLQEIFDALNEAANTAEARCILLRGEGKHFCAGADVGDVSASAAEGARYGVGFEQLLRAIEEHPLPVIARVHGAALGAGCQLLAACDLSIAAEDAQIGIPSAKLGLLLDLEKIQRMIRVIGVAHTRELLLTGRPVTGKEAAVWGLVSKAVKERELDFTTDLMTQAVAGGAPLSVRGSKAAIRELLDAGSANRGTHQEMFSRHDVATAAALNSEDIQEGIRALKERRPPEFKGR